EPVPPVTMNVFCSNMRGSSVAPEPGRVHTCDQRGPWSGDIAGCRCESLRIERAIDSYRVIRLNRDVFSVDVRNQPKQLQFRNWLRRHVIQSAQFRARKYAIRDHARELDPGQPRKNRSRKPVHDAFLIQEPLDQPVSGLQLMPDARRPYREDQALVMTFTDVFLLTVII